jgi:quercetin dioxygenase-like cupin family protein
MKAARLVSMIGRFRFLDPKSFQLLNMESGMNAMSEIKVGQLVIRYLVDGSADGSLGLFELTVPPGSNVPPPHSHSLNEECIYVLEGKLRYAVGDDTRDLVAGESMLSPKGTVHRFSNPFDAAARALIVQSPDIGPQYFKDVGAVVNAGGPPDKAALVAVMSRYGLVPAAPGAAVGGA